MTGPNRPPDGPPEIGETGDGAGGVGGGVTPGTGTGKVAPPGNGDGTVSGGGTGTITLPGSGKTRLTGSAEISVIGAKVIGGKVTVRSFDGEPEPSNPPTPPRPPDGIKLIVDTRVGVKAPLTFGRVNSNLSGRSIVRSRVRGNDRGFKKIGGKNIGE